MLGFIVPFFRVCFFKASTSLLPYSKNLLGGLILTKLILYFFIQKHFIAEVPIVHLLLGLVVSTLTLILVISFILNKNKCQARLHKTLMAIFGTDLIFMFLQMLLYFGLSEMTPVGLLLLISIWELFVRGYIFKCGIDTTLFTGVMIALFVQILEGLPIFLIQVQYLQLPEKLS